MVIRRFLVPFAIALFTSMLILPASAAERVEHDTQTVPFYEIVRVEGEEAACLEGADTFILNRTDVYQITEVISGPNAGSMHLKFKSEGTFHALAGNTTIANGTIHAHLNFKTHRGDRRLNFSEILVGTTPHGEPVKYMIHSHFTRRDGELTRAIFKVNCIQ